MHTKDRDWLVDRDLVLELSRRTILAHLGSIMEQSLREVNPVVGFAVLMKTETGQVMAMECGMRPRAVDVAGLAVDIARTEALREHLPPTEATHDTVLRYGHAVDHNTRTIIHRLLHRS